MKMPILQTRLLSSLAKVFSDEDLSAPAFEQGSMLANEVYSFQIAYRISPEYREDSIECRLDVQAGEALAGNCLARRVIPIQSDLPCYEDHDEHVLRTEPGLYPDLLRPFKGHLTANRQWQAVWITINHEKNVLPSGQHSIVLSFESEEHGRLAAETFSLCIYDCTLPEQSLIHTMWFHTDCIATLYDVQVFSEEHWQLIDKYMKTAVEHGINMILTPIFTPPLDTQIGGERPTVQLVDVFKNGNSYSFGFDRLKRWVDLCRKNGIKYLEFSHLFTQWGAKHAPKIIAIEYGAEKRIFGWETDSTGPEYEHFLDEFLPALTAFIRENGLEQSSWFHVSDEPSEEHITYYQNASRILKKHLKGFPIMDALSSYSFYENGLVEKPIPASNHIEPFLENKVPDLWTYYCCGQYKKVSNRFFSMPSARNRILGIQLYKFSIKGFLQWGYNFWYSHHSLYPIDPFMVTDGDKAFPSGDPFVVYPGEEGPLESLRLEVFYEGLQDLRALIRLEEKIGREAVIKLLEEGLDRPISFSEYPRDDAWLLNKREEINKLLAQ
ncbi:MAG TPA: DUF4091 domain-containing protein [Clostridiales bacterium]|nr:DUF4091 domain-containing protein [Clostridiales bacterium]